MKLSLALPLLVFIVSTLTSCGKENQEVRYRNIPEFDELQKMHLAPMSIQASSKAIVRVSSHGGQGTGFFINATGLLMTNNHVLGTKNCLLEGCFALVSFDLEHKKKSQDVKVFAKPIFISPQLDVSVFQMAKADKSEKIIEPLLTPDYLSFSTLKDDFTNDTAYIVGHPLGTLKKWNKTKVTQITGDWFETDAFVLSGQSGSPLLNDQGRVIGVIHRSRQADDSTIRRSGINSAAIGSTAKSISKNFQLTTLTSNTSHGLELFPQLSKLQDLLEISALQDIYFNTRASYHVSTDQSLKLNSQTQQKILPEILLNACMMNLENKAIHDTSELYEITRVCYDAKRWLNCSENYSGNINYYCPREPSVRKKWIDTFEKISDLFLEFNHPNNSIAFLLSFYTDINLEANVAETMNNKLHQLLQTRKPELTDALAFIIAGYSTESSPTYQGVNLNTFNKNYKSRLGYENYLSKIAMTYLNLNLYTDQVISFYKELLLDPMIHLKDYLAIEEQIYHYEQL